MWRALLGPMGFLLFLVFLMNFALTSFEGVFGLYAAHRYAYGPAQVGLVLTVIGLISAVAQGMLTGPLTRRWGESWVIKASMLGSAVGFPLMLLANSMPGVLLTVGLFVLANAMLRPVTSAMISKRAEGGQGMAMGLNNAFQSLGRIVGPLWAGALFDVQISYPYLSSALIMLAGFVACLFWLPRDDPGPTPAVAAAPPD
jgi:DHA1 family multidrug resistance protein-like MFS transporter